MPALPALRFGARVCSTPRRAGHENGFGEVRRLVEENLIHYIRLARNKFKSIDVDLVDGGVHYGLLQAARRYDKNCGVKFQSFATSRVFGAVRDHIRDFDPNRRTINKRIKILYLEDLYKVHGWQNSLGSYHPENGGMEDLLPRGLTKLERYIIQKYFYDNLTMAEIGQRVGLTESGVCVIRKRAYGKIKDSITQK